MSNTYIGGTLLAGGTTFRWHTACGGDHTQYTMNRCEPCIKRHCPVGKWRALLGELSMQYIVIHHEHQWQAKIEATKKSSIKARDRPYALALIGAEQQQDGECRAASANAPRWKRLLVVHRTPSFENLPLELNQHQVSLLTA